MNVFGSIFKIAIGALTANKLRSGLTLVGIIFGVTSIMTIMSALEGMMGSIEKDLNKLGPSTFMVSKLMSAFSEEEFLKKIKRKPINMHSYEAIADGCSSCELISPRAFNSSSVKYGSESFRRIFIMGGTSDMINIIDFEVAQGRFHSPEDDLSRRAVAFIGDDLREKFFPHVDPLGKVIKLGSKKYTVIGVAKAQGESFGESRDDFAIIPLSTFARHFGMSRNRGLNILVKANSIESLPDAMDEVRMILRSQRGVPFDDEDDFDMLTAESAMEMLNNITAMFRTVMVLISAISLGIGGIVVMNIMMVAVSERTREIGIRKSLGAKKKHILWQFLSESVVVTSLGGMIGVVFGFLIAKSLVGMIDMEIEPSVLAIVSGLSMSTGIGLIFGIYPAMKAANLDPIKALSYE